MVFSKRITCTYTKNHENIEIHNLIANHNSNDINLLYSLGKNAIYGHLKFCFPISTLMRSQQQAYFHMIYFRFWLPYK